MRALALGLIVLAGCQAEPGKGHESRAFAFAKEFVEKEVPSADFGQQTFEETVTAEGGNKYTVRGWVDSPAGRQQFRVRMERNDDADEWRLTEPILFYEE